MVETDPLQASGVRTKPREFLARVHAHHDAMTFWQLTYCSLPFVGRRQTGFSTRSLTGNKTPSYG